MISPTREFKTTSSDYYRHERRASSRSLFTFRGASSRGARPGGGGARRDGARRARAPGDPEQVPERVRVVRGRLPRRGRGPRRDRVRALAPRGVARVRSRAPRGRRHRRADERGRGRPRPRLGRSRGRQKPPARAGPPRRARDAAPREPTGARPARSRVVAPSDRPPLRGVAAVAVVVVAARQPPVRPRRRHERAPHHPARPRRPRARARPGRVRAPRLARGGEPLGPALHFTRRRRRRRRGRARRVDVGSYASARVGSHPRREHSRAVPPRARAHRPRRGGALEPRGRASVFAFASAFFASAIFASAFALPGAAADPSVGGRALLPAPADHRTLWEPPGERLAVGAAVEVMALTGRGAGAWRPATVRALVSDEGGVREGGGGIFRVSLAYDSCVVGPGGGAAEDPPQVLWAVFRDAPERLGTAAGGDAFACPRIGAVATTGAPRGDGANGGVAEVRVRIRPAPPPSKTAFFDRRVEGTRERVACEALLVPALGWVPAFARDDGETLVVTVGARAAEKGGGEGEGRGRRRRASRRARRTRRGSALGSARGGSGRGGTRRAASASGRRTRRVTDGTKTPTATATDGTLARTRGGTPPSRGSLASGPPPRRRRTRRGGRRGT